MNIKGGRQKNNNDDVRDEDCRVNLSGILKTGENLVLSDLISVYTVVSSSIFISGITQLLFLYNPSLITIESKSLKEEGN